MALVVVALEDTYNLPPHQARVAVPAWLAAAVILTLAGSARCTGWLADNRLSFVATICALAQSAAAITPIVLTGDVHGRLISLVISLLAPAAILTSSSGMVINTGLCLGLFGAVVYQHPGAAVEAEMPAVAWTVFLTGLVGLIRLRGLQRIDQLAAACMHKPARMC